MPNFICDSHGVVWTLEDAFRMTQPLNAVKLILQNALVIRPSTELSRALGIVEWLLEGQTE